MMSPFFTAAIFLHGYWLFLWVLICIFRGLMVFSTFHVLIFYLWIFFGKMSVYTFCLFSNLIIFTVEFWEFLHILDTYLSDTWFTNIFLLVCSLFFHIYMFFHKAQVFNLNKMKLTIFFLFALCFWCQV